MSAYTVLSKMSAEWELAVAIEDDEARDIHLWDRLAIDSSGEAFPLRWFSRGGEIERLEILRDGEWRDFP